jgi:hypothetical protein
MTATERRKRAKPLMSVSEAGRELGIGTTTAYEWARAGAMPGLARINGRLYVRRAVLMAYINGADVMAPEEQLPTTLAPDRNGPNGRRATG